MRWGRRSSSRNGPPYERSTLAGFATSSGGGPFGVAPGETTDDTAMMLGIARACGPGGIDMETVAANFVAWMASGPKDIGNTTREALWRIRSGTRWDEAGEAMQAESRSGVAGNGSVMRVAPVALRFRSSPERMIHAAFDSSRVTHANPRAKWGCVAVCQGLAHLLDGGQVEGVLDAAARDIPEPSVVEAVRSAAYRAEEDVDSGGFVLVTVNAAFWCLLRAEHAGDVILRAAMLGYDADTTAIVSGALGGAAYGLETIPQRWRDVVHHRGELESIAAKLLAWNRVEASTSRADA